MRPPPPATGSRRGGPLAAGLALASLLALPGMARAAVVLDAFGQGSAAASPDLTDTPFTVGTGSNRLMLITVSIAGDATVVAASFRGTPAERFFALSNGSTTAPCRTEIWRILDPPSGPGFVAVTLSQASAFGVGVVSYSGVDQASPTVLDRTAIGATSPIRVVSSVADGRPLVGVACLGGTWPMRAGPDAVAGLGDTTLWDFTEHDIVGLGSQQTAMVGGQVSWNVTFSGAFVWAAVGLTLTPAVVAPPDAGPDAAPDATADVRAPDDAVVIADTAADLAPPPPNAGDDGPGAADAGEAADADADADVDGGGGVADAGVDEPAIERVDAAPISGDEGGTTVRDVNLQVGCACRLGGGGRPSLLVALALALLIARRRR